MPQGKADIRAAAQLEKPSPKKRGGFSFPLRRKPAAPKPALLQPKKRRASDVVIIGAGISLGLVCALFPWYIFLNQDKFGITPHYSGKLPQGTPGLANGPFRIGINWSLPDKPGDSLDTLATGAVEQKASKPVEPADQPFPGDKAMNFDLVQVANGRAMIEDADGFWLVEVGSSLPDDSRVRSIEQRAGKWVLVTTQDRVVRLVSR